MALPLLPLCNCFLRILLLVLLLRSVLALAVCFCIVRWRFCFTLPGTETVVFVVVGCSGCRVLFVSWVFVGTQTRKILTYTYVHSHLCLLARVHFHFISVIAKLFVLNIFLYQRLFHFISKRSLCCRGCRFWFLHSSKVVCCYYFWYFMRRAPLLQLFPLLYKYKHKNRRISI